MPLFYLQLWNGNSFTEDEAGCELSDLAAARKRAIEGLRDVMAGELRRGELNLGACIEIEDESHTIVMTVQFAEAVRVTTRHLRRP
jgi:hypothetical protein